MITAFVFINTRIGFEAAVLKALRTIEGVEQVHLVFGLYDLVVKINANNMHEVQEIVHQHVRKIQEVSSTLTLPVVHY